MLKATNMQKVINDGVISYNIMVMETCRATAKRTLTDNNIV
jgi:hypothetical protein